MDVGILNPVSFSNWARRSTRTPASSLSGFSPNMRMYFTYTRRHCSLYRISLTNAASAPWLPFNCHSNCSFLKKRITSHFWLKEVIQIKLFLHNMSSFNTSQLISISMLTYFTLFSPAAAAISSPWTQLFSFPPISANCCCNLQIFFENDEASFLGLQFSPLFSLIILNHNCFLN